MGWGLCTCKCDLLVMDHSQSLAALQILPCTVSQLLSATESNDVFIIGDTEINQVQSLPFVALDT